MIKKISHIGIDFIKHFEGCRLQAYLDSANVPTIGYGNTRIASMGLTITQKEADQLLVEDVAITETQVNLLNLNLNQNQYDAIISFVFNLGIGNFKRSTLLKRIKEYPDNSIIASELFKWRYAAKKVLPGLRKRRLAEAQLYFTGQTYSYEDTL